MIQKNQNDTPLDKLAVNYPVFAKMEPELFQAAFRRSRFNHARAGTSLFLENQPCHEFPFVLSGKIRVFKASPNGREITLYSVSSGDVCAVTAGCILGQHPYSAEAVVEADCELVTISADAFETLLSVNIFREFIFSLFSSRLQDLMMLIDAVAFQRLDRRLAALLLKQGDQITTTHQRLADELGTVREMISRVLKNFSEAGWIILKREGIEIRDKAGLNNMLECECAPEGDQSHRLRQSDRLQSQDKTG